MPKSWTHKKHRTWWWPSLDWGPCDNRGQYRAPMHAASKRTTICTNLHVHVNTLLLRILHLSPIMVKILQTKNIIHNMNNMDTSVRFEVFTVLKINTVVLWVMTTCSPTDRVENTLPPPKLPDGGSISEYNILLCFVHNRKSTEIRFNHH
jgi:hypothetical protein